MPIAFTTTIILVPMDRFQSSNPIKVFQTNSRNNKRMEEPNSGQFPPVDVYQNSSVSTQYAVTAPNELISRSKIRTVNVAAKQISGAIAETVGWLSSN